MYRAMPRRTSEFREDAHEDGEKRQTRLGMRSMATPTPMKGSSMAKRPSNSRLGQPLCLERDRGSQMGVPPNRTPMSSHRKGSEVPHHSNKKWVAEKAQQIQDYLHAILPSHAIQGITGDFFNRGSGLRQMTTKQFVGIINFFFHQISRNRVTVGSNHVEDIMNTLQKLNYPYQVNKSSLMTPTTQHSFGHVIVMLDFLMDFAPQPEAVEEGRDFPFMETAEQHSAYMHSMASESLAMSTTQTPAIVLDEELIELLLVQSTACFSLWDQENNEEEALLQARTRDKVINKKCDLADSRALDADIDALKKKLSDLELKLEESLPGDGKRFKQLESLSREQNQLGQQLQAIQQEDVMKLNSIQELRSSAKQKTADLKALRKELRHIQQTVSSQRYTAQQLKDLQVQCTDRSNESKVYERQIKEITERELNQQVMLSRSKQKLLDKIEQFNCHARNICMDSVICKASGKAKMELTLSLQPRHEEVLHGHQRLAKLADRLRLYRQQTAGRCKHVEDEKANLIQIKGKLDTQLASLGSELRAQKQSMAHMEASHKSKLETLAHDEQQLIDTQYELATRMEQLQAEESKQHLQLNNVKQQNEDLITGVELRQQQALQAHNSYLDRYEETLAEAEEELKAVQLTIEENEKKLSEAKQQICSTELPSFDVVFQAIKNY
ncbi:kinetochore protein NDC80 homolog [Drosophila guanche]|uniref:Kinetochore protein NDC80 n=1 Tax=Drosophila guanche TaxID=7266 RepID=A0A3B0KRK5_DROGU|nr:kinetochore protein NDC80 homolog [Drosophila guanche]SPP86548.1 blast:Coiled-coil domain-containing protein 147 [Drosophila guanche]